MEMREHIPKYYGQQRKEQKKRKKERMIYLHCRIIIKVESCPTTKEIGNRRERREGKVEQGSVYSSSACHQPAHELPS